MIRCAHCGNMVPPHARYCNVCGSPAAAAYAAPPPPPPPPPQPGAGNRLFRDLRSLRLPLFFPFRQWIAEKPWTLGWVQLLMFLAFYPLLIDTLFEDQLRLQDSAWAIGLYFGAIWAFILYRVIQPGRINLKSIAGTFLFTSIVGIAFVLIAQGLPFFSQLYAIKRTNDIAFRLFGYVLGVGVLEETAKAAPIFFLFLVQKGQGSPREAAFLGVISGLGFGVAEAVTYAGVYADRLNNGQISYATFVVALFLRMISLPLLHALWTGILSYFIGVAARVPAKSGAIVVLGLASLALIHGVYDTFSDTFIGFGLCLVSLLAFLMYMRSAERIANEVAAAHAQG